MNNLDTELNWLFDHFKLNATDVVLRNNPSKDDLGALDDNVLRAKRIIELVKQKLA